MGKIEELRAKYPKMSQATFTKLTDGDWTPTKKYTEYILRAWSKKNEFYASFTIPGLIGLVKEYDELLPYIDEKDIYNKSFLNIAHLREVIGFGRVKKDEKTFVREDHVQILFEDENLLILRPLTHKGSLKYGYQTRWCTAMVGHEGHFNQYKNKFLVYVINKKNNKPKNYNKLAIIVPGTSDLFKSALEVYNESDSSIGESALLSNGWSYEELQFLNLHFRNHVYESKQIKVCSNKINKTITLMQGINLDEVVENIAFMENAGQKTEESKKILADFITKVQDFNKNFEITHK